MGAMVTNGARVSLPRSGDVVLKDWQPAGTIAAIRCPRRTDTRRGRILDQFLLVVLGCDPQQDDGVEALPR